MCSAEWPQVRLLRGAWVLHGIGVESVWICHTWIFQVCEIGAFFRFHPKKPTNFGRILTYVEDPGMSMPSSPPHTKGPNSNFRISRHYLEGHPS